MWFDEGGQFFIAKGIHYHTACIDNINNGTLSNVIFMNNHYNHDPGGYSIFLHFWTKISNNYAFIRSLNFFIFIIVIFIWYKSLQMFFENKKVIFTIIGILLISNSLSIANMAVEVRGYMMEIIAVSIGFYTIIITNKHITNNKKLLPLAFVALLIFSTARYSTLLFTLVIFAYCILYNKELNKKIIFFLIIFIVLISLIYYYSLRIQNPKIHTMSYLIYLDSLKNVKVVISKNLVYLLMLSFLFYARVFKFIRNEKIVTIVNFSILLNVIFIFTSIFSKYPFNPDSNRGLVFSLFTILTFLILIFDMFKTLSNFTSYCCLVISAFAIAKQGSVSREHSNKSFIELLNKIQITVSKNDKVFCSYWCGISLKSYEFTTKMIFSDTKLKYQPMPPHNIFSTINTLKIPNDYNFVIQSGWMKTVVPAERIKGMYFMDGAIILEQYK
jgi:hypothetical protein